MFNEEQDGKILITGGLGAIGMDLSKTLVNAGRDIIVYDWKNYCDVPQPIPGLRVVTEDIRDGQQLLQILSKEKISGVIHLAAVSQVGAAEKDYALCASVNARGTLNLVTAIEKSGIKPWIVNISSRDVYGNPKCLPVSESHSLDPINRYGVTKVVAEKIISYYGNALGIDAITLRPSNIYGSIYDLPDRLIPRLINNALTGTPVEIYGGEQILDLLHISDAVEGIIHAMSYLEWMVKEEYYGGYYDVFNLATGTPHTIQDVIHQISQQCKTELKTVHLEPRPYDVQHYIGDPTKAHQQLGFKAKMSLDDGLMTTVDLYRRVLDLSSSVKLQNLREEKKNFNLSGFVT